MSTIKEEIDKLRDFKAITGNKFNVILFGTSGAGKTSFINLLGAVFNTNNEVPNLASARPLDWDNVGSYTPEMKAHIIPGSHLKVFDTRGWYKDSSFTSGEFLRILKGPGLPEPSPEVEIDAVIFVVSKGVAVDFIVAMKPFFLEAKNSGKVCVVVVTKLDVENTVGELSPAAYFEKLETSAAFTEVMSAVHKAWEDPAVTVVPVVNYAHGRYNTNEAKTYTGVNLLRRLRQEVTKLYKVTPPSTSELNPLFKGEKRILGIYTPF